MSDQIHWRFVPNDTLDLVLDASRGCKIGIAAPEAFGQKKPDTLEDMRSRAFD
jgi:hypothetical protein